MSLEVFHQALDLCEDYGSPPFLGGGEPTIHPDFETMLLESIVCAAQIGEGTCGIITNGKEKKRALMIAALVKADVMYGELSLDYYHDRISYEVMDAFRNNIRDVTNNGQKEPMPHGRAKEVLGVDFEESEDYRGESECPCNNMIIKPNGDIHVCGCEDSPCIGDVFSGISVSWGYDCYHSREFIEQCEEAGMMEVLGY
jgi:hypothetical protein